MPTYLINQELKLIVCFSAKCGSQTVVRWFLDGMNLKPEAVGSGISHYMVEPAKVPDFENYLKVMVLRDPLRRLVSFYAHWVLRDNTHWCFADRDRRFQLHSKSFRQFIYVLDHLSRHAIRFQHHLQPQVENVTHVRFDRVLQVETLDRDLGALNRALSINADISHLHRCRYDKNLREPAVDRSPAWFSKRGVPEPGWFYDSETRAIAERVYAEDAEFYRARSGKLLTAMINS